MEFYDLFIGYLIIGCIITFTGVLWIYFNLINARDRIFEPFPHVITGLILTVILWPLVIIITIFGD